MFRKISASRCFVENNSNFDVENQLNPNFPADGLFGDVISIDIGIFVFSSLSEPFNYGFENGTKIDEKNGIGCKFPALK